MDIKTIETVLTPLFKTDPIAILHAINNVTRYSSVAVFAEEQEKLSKMNASIEKLIEEMGG